MVSDFFCFVPLCEQKKKKKKILLLELEPVATDFDARVATLSTHCAIAPSRILSSEYVGLL